jgi:hypothetical protein
MGFPGAWSWIGNKSRIIRNKNCLSQQVFRLDFLIWALNIITRVAGADEGCQTATT